MICKEEMLNLLLEVSPSFTPVWETFLEEWEGEKNLPLYLVLADLARHIRSLIKTEQEIELQEIFRVVERWHLEGDPYVKNAASVGLLEYLQNTNVVGEGTPEKIEIHLLPESKRFWIKVNEFWETGKLISE